jgi:hypothetical protein
MNKKIMAIVTVLCIGALISPVFADIFIPPGPPTSMSEYVTPTLSVINAATKTRIGWTHTDGLPTWQYNALYQYGGVAGAGNLKEDPVVPSGSTLDIPYGTKVTIFGFFPGVAVSADQVPPSVELKITWNGIPNLITLSLPSSQVVGLQYPPTMYPDINTFYQFAYPAAPPGKNATYNIWVGDYYYMISKIGSTMFGSASTTTSSSGVPSWFEQQYGYQNGLWFWYTFTPNVGDWIAYDSNGFTKFPPTYDVTALLEYGTSQVWTNHVCWDVSLLELHKDVNYCTDQIINDMITVTNVGILPATGLQLTQTFPWDDKTYLNPEYVKACAAIRGGRVIPPTPLVNFQGVANPSVFTLPAPFNVLNPGETLIITMPIDLYNLDNENVTIVFDSMMYANEIPPWKAPIGLASIVVGNPTGSLVPLWQGFKFGAYEPLDFDTIALWFVRAPIVRMQLQHVLPVMTLDPEPVPLIAGETAVTAADVALVQKAVVGLAPYDVRMDCNGNGRIDLEDLKLFELAV